MTQILRNTVKAFSNNLKQIFYMRPPPLRRRVDLYTFNSPSSISSLISGSDKEIGGYSECSLEWVQDNTHQNHHLLFKGNISFDLNPNSLSVAAGYCAFRTEKLVGTLFGSVFHDISLFSHFEVKARSLDPGKKFLLNITPSTFADVDLYQYPLKFVSKEWHTFRIPISRFILTHGGFVTKVQNPLPADRIETIGISILKEPGPFQLEVAHFAAANPNEISLEELELREMGLDEEEEEWADPRLNDLFHTVKVYVDGDNEVKTYDAGIESLSKIKKK